MAYLKRPGFCPGTLCGGGAKKVSRLGQFRNYRGWRRREWRREGGREKTELIFLYGIFCMTWGRRVCEGYSCSCSSRQTISGPLFVHFVELNKLSYQCHIERISDMSRLGIYFVRVGGLQCTQNVAYIVTNPHNANSKTGYETTACSKLIWYFKQ